MHINLEHNFFNDCYRWEETEGNINWDVSANVWQSLASISMKSCVIMPNSIF